jgi:hypothetical protein
MIIIKAVIIESNVAEAENKYKTNFYVRDWEKDVKLRTL